MKIYLFVHLVLGVLLVGQESRAQDRVASRTWSAIAEPSNERLNIRNDVQRGWLCYGRTGLLQDDCKVSFQLFESKDPVDVTGVTTNCVLDPDGGIAPLTCGHGGHVHNSPVRPVIFDQTEVRYVGDMDGRPLFVEGPSPLNLGDGFLWTVPQVGGYYEFKAGMLPPDGKKFLEFTFVPGGVIITTVDRAEATGRLNVTARADGLKQLPDDNVTFYRKDRNGDAEHPDAVSYAAQDITHAALRAIGRSFNNNTGSLISYNDISLPKGGLFEVFANTNPWVAGLGHVSHREGLHVDVNKPNQQRCDFNTSVQAAVDMVLTRNLQNPDPNSTSALLCETKAVPNTPDTGNYHIVITNIKLLSGFQGFFL